MTNTKNAENGEFKKLCARGRLWVIWARMWCFTRITTEPKKKCACYLIGQSAAWCYNHTKKWWMPPMPYLTPPTEDKYDAHNI